MINNNHNNGWISINERFPDSRKEILICIVDFFESPAIDVAYLTTETDGTIYFEGTKYSFYREYVTHWQALPELPKEINYES